MKNRLMNIQALLVALMCTATTMAPMNAAAAQGVCARGTVSQVYAGGWNQDGLVVTIDYEAGFSAPNDFNGSIRFSPGLSDRRLKSLTAMALMAVANGNPVIIYTHNDTANGVLDCSNATEMRVCRTSCS